MAVERSFCNIPEGKLDEADQQSFLVSLGWSNALGWDELLRSKRILIVSEAGAGKTYECQNEQKRLWDAGEPAFYLELATLATSDVRSMLSHAEEQRLNAWLASQSDVATFFLDSVDELKLSIGSFEQALKRLNKGIAGQLGRAKFVITTRPIPFDEELIRELLLVPEVLKIEDNGDTFAHIAMQGYGNNQEAAPEDAPADWRKVALMPLSDAQIMELASGQSVDDPQALLDDLQRRNAQEFARRPQDLIELCADWRDFKRIRTHQEQLASNISIKLKPRDDGPELAELSVDKALDGASRLALAMMVTRRLTLRHNAKADIGGEDTAFDPAVILPAWSKSERETLLQRPLFGFASYGRVRFHHRSVAEYLAAKRIQSLRDNGMTARALKRLIFAEIKGKTIVRPSKRAIAGWLALTDDMIFEMLRDHEPVVLLDEGDPESLTVPQRTQALRAYVERYGQGGWRGLNVPYIQIHRFASSELASEVNRLWVQGIENPEIREMLLQLIGMGRMVDCSELVHTVAIDAQAPNTERLIALEALVALGDSRLEEITADMAENVVLWPDSLALGAVIRLFPKHLTVTHLCMVLERVTVDARCIGILEWHLPRLISEAEMNVSMLEALRDGLCELASAELRWQGSHHEFNSDRTYLSYALAATCIHGLRAGINTAWLRASVLAIRLPHKENRTDEVFTELKKMLATLSAEHNSLLFWADDTFLQSLHSTANPWERFSQIGFFGPVQLTYSRDLGWLSTELADVARPLVDRAMLLEAAMRLTPSDKDAWRDHLAGLKAFVADQPDLLARIEEHLKAANKSQKLQKWEVEAEKRKKQQERKQAKAYASWVMFWREIEKNPDKVFSSEQSDSTAWSLWCAMRNAEDESHESDWNRRFIEMQFSREVADQLRLTLMQQWRRVTPLLNGQLSEVDRGTSLMLFKLGLAGIYAEAEDPLWATNISEEEASLAARYATIELNRLPLWLDALVTTYPAAVDSTLGEELSRELESHAGAQWHSMVLQGISYASDAVVAVFIPRLRVWLDANGDRSGHNEDQEGAAQRLERVVNVLMKHDDPETRTYLQATAKQRLSEELSKSSAYVWLPTLMRLDASAGVDELEKRLAEIEPEVDSEAITWFSMLFGDQNDNINLDGLGFTPSILLRLLRLSYQHVRPSDDNIHEATSYTANERDHAERGRGNVVNALLNAKGEEGWAAKLEMADDPLCAYFKDRILALAEETQAEEVDSVAFDDAQAIELDNKGEASPSSNEAIYMIMVDKLVDLDELLLRDESPHAAWANIKDEKVMRRVIAHELKGMANDLYKIDQESVTAEEKETDIRLRSTISAHEAVIELKLGNKNRSARELREALNDQLVTKYLAPETRRSGCLMITLAEERQWEHPDTGVRIGFEELIQLLRDEAIRLEQSLGGIRLCVHALDLRPRLPTERG
jgi:hypothetical protein